MSRVRSVSPNILESLIKENEIVVCKFFSPRCGYCREFKPVYENMSNEISGPTFVEINVTENANVSSRYGIEYLPTTKVYYNGGVKSFVGNRSADISNFIRFQLSQAKQ